MCRGEKVPEPVKAGRATLATHEKLPTKFNVLLVLCSIWLFYWFKSSCSHIHWWMFFHRSLLEISHFPFKLYNMIYNFNIYNIAIWKLCISIKLLTNLKQLLVLPLKEILFNVLFRFVYYLQATFSARWHCTLQILIIICIMLKI